MLHPRPVERTLALAATVIGALVLIAAIPGSPYEPSLAIAHLPNVLQALIGAPLLVGGALLLHGLRSRSLLSTRGVGAIRAGATLAAAGFAADTIAIVLLHPEASVQLVFAVTGAAIGWQWQVLAGQEAAALRQVAEEVEA